MFKDTLPRFNGTNFISYFIIKEDREKMGKNLSPDSRTVKILSSKDGETKHLREITSWVANELQDKKILIIPFPSTNKEKPCSQQLPFLITKQLATLSSKWVDGSGIIYRRFSLPKNTRDEVQQYKSLSFDADKLKGFENILILDDVITSGSSLKAGLKLLLPTRSNVAALAIARKVHLEEVPFSEIY